MLPLFVVRQSPLSWVSSECESSSFSSCLHGRMPALGAEQDRSIGSWDWESSSSSSSTILMAHSVRGGRLRLRCLRGSRLLSIWVPFEGVGSSTRMGLFQVLEEDTCSTSVVGDVATQV
ncbi:hypothetical protein ACFE04_011515 [Oxalis oulophora]